MYAVVREEHLLPVQNLYIYRERGAFFLINVLEGLGGTMKGIDLDVALHQAKANQSIYKE